MSHSRITAVLKRYVEAVCWLARTEGGVLVVTADYARLVDGAHSHNEGLSLRAAGALTNDPRRARCFDIESEGGRRRMSLNSEGEMYHRQLVARKECSCPRVGAGGR
jgi:hypothetical protein